MSPYSFFRSQNESYTGMPMGYGTIASNGASLGSNSQTISSLQTQNLYTEQQGVQFHSTAEAIKTLNKIQDCNHMPEGKFLNPTLKSPKPNREEITQSGREVTSIGLLEGLPFTLAII